MGVISKSLLFALFALILCPSVVHASEQSTQNTKNTDEVTAILEDYIRLDRAYAPEIFDLYSDEARIHITRIYAGDVKQKMELKMPDYREIGAKIQKIAKGWRDVSTYSNFLMEDDSGIVTVTAHRYSHRKNFSSPIKWVFLKNEDGDWKIFEEHFTTRY